MSEREIIAFVRKHFESQNFEGMQVREEKTGNPKIDKLLKSKALTDNIGKPDLLVFGLPEDLLIVIECKSDTNKHQSNSGHEYADYAVDGVINYMSYLTKEFDVIGIAVSGKPEYHKVSTFLGLKSENQFRNIGFESLFDIEKYLQIYKHIINPKTTVNSRRAVKEFSRKLHNDIRDRLSLSEEEKPLLISAILVALNDNAFRTSYMKKEKEEDVAKTMLDTIEQVLRKQDGIEPNKISLMTAQYEFIRMHPVLITKSKYPLSEMIHDIEHNIYPYFTKNGFGDILGDFYREFLIYAASDKKLGIVITPPHITELFADIVDINKTDIVIDNCCGTGGFLIDAMKKMLKDVSKEEELDIKRNRLYGIELKPKMFTLACANMFVNKDGKSNIYQGNCFTVELPKEIKPTVAELNPPYSLKGEDLSELHFVKNAIDRLSKNGRCIAIVPMSCVIKSSEMKEILMREHTLEAVMSMPNDLFYPVGVVPCIMVWKAHVPHKSDVETWFGYWKDDGFIKDKVEGRIDGLNKWQEKDKEEKPIEGTGIKAIWLDHWRNRREVLGMSVKAKVGPRDEWCAEAYMKTDYSTISEGDFDSLVKDLIAWRIQND